MFTIRTRFPVRAQQLLEAQQQGGVPPFSVTFKNKKGSGRVALEVVEEVSKYIILLYSYSVDLISSTGGIESLSHIRFCPSSRHILFTQDVVDVHSHIVRLRPTEDLPPSSSITAELSSLPSWIDGRPGLVEEKTSYCRQYKTAPPLAITELTITGAVLKLVLNQALATALPEGVTLEPPPVLQGMQWAQGPQLNSFFLAPRDQQGVRPPDFDVFPPGTSYILFSFLSSLSYLFCDLFLSYLIFSSILH